MLHFLIQTHDFESSRSDLLVDDKHEGGSQHRLQQLGLQAFVQTKNTVIPATQNVYRNDEDPDI